MEVGARPRSILDQTIGGRSTDLFFFYGFNTIGEKIVQFPTETNSQRILRARGIPLPCVFLVAGTEQQGKTRPTGPGLEGELYLFQIEWGVNRKASVLGLGAFGPLSIFFVVEKGEGV